MQYLAMIGRWLVLVGIGLIVVGGVFWLIGRTSALQNLPGTITIERENFTCIIPLAASILISAVLTVLWNLIVRIMQR